MTNTTPRRRITLHFSHIGFTDGRTFIIPSSSMGRKEALATAGVRRYHSRTKTLRRWSAHESTR